MSSHPSPLRTHCVAVCPSGVLCPLQDLRVRRLVLQSSLLVFADALPVIVRTTRASPASTVVLAGELAGGSSQAAQAHRLPWPLLHHCGKAEMDVTAFSSWLWAADQIGHTYAEKRFIVSLKFSVFPGGPSQVSMQASLGPTPLVSYSLFCCCGFSPRPLALTRQTLLTSLLSTACVWTSPRPMPEATTPCGCCIPNRGLQLSPDPDMESQLPTPWSERRLGDPSLTQSSVSPFQPSISSFHERHHSHPASQHGVRI